MARQLASATGALGQRHYHRRLATLECVALLVTLVLLGLSLMLVHSAFVSNASLLHNDATLAVAWLISRANSHHDVCSSAVLLVALCKVYVIVCGMATLALYFVMFNSVGAEFDYHCASMRNAAQRRLAEVAALREYVDVYRRLQSAVKLLADMTSPSVHPRHSCESKRQLPAECCWRCSSRARVW